MPGIGGGAATFAATTAPITAATPIIVAKPHLAIHASIRCEWARTVATLGLRAERVKKCDRTQYGRGAGGLRGEELDGPGAFGAGEEAAFVEAVGGFLPELDRVGGDEEGAPV